MLYWSQLFLIIVLISSLQAADTDEEQGPKIIQEPEYKIFDTEGSFSYEFLECEAEGNPYPEYKWQKDGSELNIANDDHLTLFNGRLYITEPTDNVDEGEYQCFASNKLGTVASKKIEFQFGYIREFENIADDSISVEEYRSVVLECPQIEAFPGLVYSWQKGVPGNAGFFPVLISSENRHIGRDGKLYIGRATDDDEGEYVCKVQNSISTLASSQKIADPIYLQVTSESDSYFIPELMHSVQDKKVMRGQDTSLQCFFGGSPSPSYKWKRKSPSSDLPANSNTNELGQTLILNNVQPEDSGDYECTAENFNGNIPSSKVSSGTLTVVTPPELVLGLEDAVRAIGEDHVFLCEADSSESLNYRWYRNGEEIGTLLRHSFADSKRELTITNLVTDDSAMYQCEAYNQPLAPEDDTVYSVITTAQLTVLDLDPYFKKELLENQLATVGGRIEIICDAVGAPKPTFTWKHNDVTINDANDAYVEIDPETGSLLIDPVAQEDEGTYECIASNTGGSASSIGNLVVKDGTSIPALTEDISVEYNKDEIIECNPIVDSSLEYVTRWLHNDKEIDINADSHYAWGSGSDLKINNAEMRQRGIYTCQVFTTLDEASASTTLTVVGPPGPPGGVRAEVSDESPTHMATLYWSIGADNGDSISNYLIEAISEYRPAWNIVKELTILETDFYEVMVNELSPYSSYQFRVIAVNGYGEGEPSLPSEEVLLKAALPEATVTNIRGEGARVGDLRIVWDLLKPDEENGPNVFYDVFYREDGKSSWMLPVQLKEPDQGVLTVKGAPLYTKYNVKIRAGNAKGTGPESGVADVYSWQEVPTQSPTNLKAKVLSASEVEVTFTGIVTDIEGDLMGYKILYYPTEEGISEEDRVTLQTDIENSQVLATIKKLVNNTEYTISAQAYSGGGVGPRSDNYKVITYKSEPTKSPQNIRIEKESDTSITVFWDSISVDLSYEQPLIGYKVLLREDIDFVEESTAYIVKSASAQSMIITGLKKSQGYLIEVMGYSQGGDGKRSTPIRFSLDDPIFGAFSNAPKMKSVCYTLLLNLIGFYILNIL